MERLETERLILDEWKLEDAEALYCYAKNPNVGPRAGWKPHDSVEESREIIENLFWKVNSWKIVLKDEGKIIGCIGLEPDKHRPGIESLEMGYWLGEEYWNRGIVTEAARAVLDYGFSKLELEVVSIQTGEQNRRSQRVIDKLGFVFEGIQRCSYVIYDGSRRGARVYSMLKEEYNHPRDPISAGLSSAEERCF